jgi:hypothetical protein
MVAVWLLERQRERTLEVESRARRFPVEGVGLPVTFGNVE